MIAYVRWNGQNRRICEKTCVIQSKLLWSNMAGMAWSTNVSFMRNRVNC